MDPVNCRCWRALFFLLERLTIRLLRSRHIAVFRRAPMPCGRSDGASAVAPHVGGRGCASAMLRSGSRLRCRRVLRRCAMSGRGMWRWAATGAAWPCGYGLHGHWHGARHSRTATVLCDQGQARPRTRAGGEAMASARTGAITTSGRSGCSMASPRAR